jgi:hypothetical protein
LRKKRSTAVTSAITVLAAGAVSLGAQGAASAHPHPASHARPAVVHLEVADAVRHVVSIGSAAQHTIDKR